MISGKNSHAEANEMRLTERNTNEGFLDRVTSAPPHTVALDNFPLFMALAAVGLGLFLLMWLSYRAEILFYAWDRPINQFFQAVRQGAQAWVVSAARFYGKAGSQGITVITILLVIFWGVRRKIRHFWLMLVTVLGVELLWLAVVFAIGRPRPVEVRTVGDIVLPSFPSGHVMLFIAFFGVLLYLYFRRLKNRTRLMALIGVVLLLLITGFVRLFFTAHYFTDVIAGYGLGLAWTAAVIPAVDYIVLTRQEERQNQASLTEVNP